MKTPVALLGWLAATAFAAAQTASAPTEKAKPSDEATITIKSAPEAKPAPSGRVLNSKNAPYTSKTTPATKAGTTTTKTADKAGAKKEEPPPKIEGMEIPRQGDKGGFLGLQIVDATFKLSFYDAKKKPVAPDAVRAVLRWNPTYKVGEERFVLNPGEKCLTSPRNVRPPYNFKLYLSLFKEPAEGAEPVLSESYVVDFKQ